jgi:phosphatidylglycerol lysyltransferase
MIKTLYFSSNINGFVAYKIGLNFNHCFDNVVSDAKYKSDFNFRICTIVEQKVLKTTYYRVSKWDLI